MAVLLALLASLSWGMSDFVAAVKARQYPLLLVLAVSQPAGMLVLAVPLIVRGEPLVADGRLLAAVAAGFGSVLALGFLYYAMANGRIVVVAPVAATGAVLPVAFGIIRGDSVSAVGLAGMVLALGGAAAAAVESGPADGQPANWLGTAAAFASAVSLGFFFTMLDIAGQCDPFWATFVTRLTACAAVLLLVLARRARSATSGRPSRYRNWSALAVIGICDAAAEISFATASTAGQLETASVLSSLYPVVTVVLAVVLLHERMRPLQIVGSVGALAGVILVAHAT
ncbi:EamA family transporter [Actinoplanes sp. NPDC026623]|uniref:EamA family transporter n=1 Tax=Actinoplanes sp. NPDC026623 TaxID=3155610 RepID=UPI00340E285F